jgi:hypothetical protein
MSRREKISEVVTGGCFIGFLAALLVFGSQISAYQPSMYNESVIAGEFPK